MIEPTPGRARCRCCSDPTTAVGGVVVVVVWEPVPVLWWGWPQGSCRAAAPDRRRRSAVLGPTRAGRTSDVLPSLCGKPHDQSVVGALGEPEAVVLDVRLRETFVAGVGDDRHAVSVSVRQPGSHHLAAVAVLLWMRGEV